LVAETGRGARAKPSATTATGHPVPIALEEHEMRKLNSRKASVLIGTTAAVTALAGVAYAYYSGAVNGSGTGSAATANTTVQNLTISASAITGLVPGTSQVTTITLANPNSFAVSYPGKTIAVSSVSGPTGCADNLVALLSGSAPWAGGVVAHNASVTLPLTVTMADSTSVDQSACNNAAFTITYSAS
jgi:hypothetical protein